MTQAPEMRNDIISAADGRLSRESGIRDVFEAKAVDELLSRAATAARTMTPANAVDLSYGCVDWFLYPQTDERPASAA
jgi:hypothetical protein